MKKKLICFGLLVGAVSFAQDSRQSFSVYPPSAVAAAAAGGQTAAQTESVPQNRRPSFELGMTKQEVRARFGLPDFYYNSSTEKYFHSVEELSIARRLGHTVDDVYSRKTAQNTYQYTIYYGLDGDSPIYIPQSVSPLSNASWIRA